MECYEEHEKLLKAGGKGVGARYLKPPPHLAGVALEKTEHAGIERKDDGDEARKAAMNVIKEKKSGMKRDHQEMSGGGFVTRFEAASLSKQQRRVRSEPQSHGEEIAILVRDLMAAEKQSAQKTAQYARENTLSS
jgi:hypothetical protein